MRTFPTTKLAVLALALSLAGSAAHAGVVIEQEHREIGEKTPSQTTTFSIEPGRLRLEARGEGAEQVWVFRADKNVMWLINPRQRTYSELTPKTMEAFRGQKDAARRQVEEALAGLPPEQRAAMEKMMGGRAAAPPQFALRKVAEGDKVGAFTCARYEVTADHQRVSEIWAAPIEQLQLGPDEFATFRQFAEFMKKLTEGLPAEGSSAQMSLKGLEQLDGFAVRQVSYENGQASDEVRVTRAERREVPAAQFELPAGFRKIDFLTAAEE